MQRLIIPFLLSVTTCFGTLQDVGFMPAANPTFLQYIDDAATVALDSATDAAAVVFLAPKAGTITKIHYSVQGVTGTPPTYIVGIEGVTGAEPDGTYKQNGGNNCTATVSSFTANNGYLQTLDYGYVATAGELLAATIRHSSGTADASNFIEVRIGSNSAMIHGSPASPFGIGYTGSWAAAGAYYVPSMAVEYSDGTILRQALPIADGVEEAHSSTTTWKGVLYTPPMDCRVIGVMAAIRNASLVDFEVAMFTGTTETTVTTVDSSETAGTNAAGAYHFYPIEPQELTADTGYRFTIIPTAATAFTDWLAFAFQSEAIRIAVCGPLEHTESSGESGGAPTGWTETAWQSLLLIPVLDQIDDGAGAGGSNGKPASATLGGELQT